MRTPAPATSSAPTAPALGLAATSAQPAAASSLVLSNQRGFVRPISPRPRGGRGRFPSSGWRQIDERTRQLLLDPAADPLLLPREWLDDCVRTFDGLDFVGIEHPTCTRSRRVLVDLSFNIEYPLPCLSWRCDGCQQGKWRAARHFFAAGMRRAWEDGRRVRLLTLTDQTGTMSIAQFSKRWDDLAKMLRRGGPAPKRPAKGAGADAWQRWYEKCRARRSLLDEYAMVLEVGRNGNEQLHAHVLVTGEYLPQRALSKWVRQYGFGKVVDIREIKPGDEQSLAAYAAKLASYTTKTGEAIEELAKRARRRLRPVRSSRGWLPGGQRGIEEALGLRAPANRENPRTDLLIVEHDGEGHWTRFKPVSGRSPWRFRPHNVP